nr:hypothetical protein [Tanacetum cinerariifolium]
MDACAALTRRVEHLEFDKVAQALEITKLKRRVKKLEKRNKVRVLKLRRLQKDDAVVLEDDKDEDKDVADAVKDVEKAKVDKSAKDQGGKQNPRPTKVQEVVDVVTTAKLITEVVTTAIETVTATSAIVTTAEAQVPTATTATLFGFGVP